MTSFLLVVAGMSTQNSSLLRKLQGDYADAQTELAQVEERQKWLRLKLQYIQTLLDSAGGGTDPEESTNNGVPGRFAGMTIADIAATILREEGKPMSGMEIAKRAITGGFQADNIERARSHFSAIISKDINGPRSKFCQEGRGAIGLIEWRVAAVAHGQPKPPPPQQPFANEEEFKEEDIPF